MSFPPSGILRTHNGLLSSWLERSGFDSRTSLNFFQVLLFFNRLGSFFCEDHYVHILKLREPLPPPPSSNQGWMVSSFGFRYASPLIWRDGDLIFHFILSKIVALIGKNPAFKLQGALYFFCDPLTYRAAVWIFKSNNLEILSLFSFEDYLFCANHALLTCISSHLYFI